MKWSIKIGRWLGIDVHLHVTFLLLLALVGAMQWAGDGSFAAAVEGVVFFAAIFGCVLLHEFGHALAARRYGIATRDITLLPIGGVARLERMPERPSQELWVALAGPAVNVVIAAGVVLWLLVVHGPVSDWGWQQAEDSFALRLLAVNVMLVLFNLIPAFPMDGGRVLRALLSFWLERARATRIAATVGQGFALVFGLAGVLSLFGGPGSPLLLVIAAFVWMGAGQEAAAVEFRSQLNGARVRDAMLTHFHAVQPGDPLARVVDLVLAGSQQDFPVIDNGRVVGVLTRQVLLNALSRYGNRVPVWEIMDPQFERLEAHESLEEVLLRWRSRPASLAPVYSQGSMVGLLTWENITELVMIRSALGASAPPPASMPPVLRAG